MSKSTLRACVEEVMKERPEDVFYWPSFEIVRWMGAYFAGRQAPAYGVADGATRHVSRRLVDTIIRLFLDCFGTEEIKRKRGQALAPAERSVGW